MIIHQADSLIAGNVVHVKTRKLSTTPKLFAYINEDPIYITALTKNKLLYYNQFPYQDCDELLQYALIVLYTLKPGLNKQEVFVSGSMTKKISRTPKIQKLYPKSYF